MYLIDLKDAYFAVLLDKSCRHLVRFFMGRESLRMSVPVFQSSTSPSSFYQDFESSNIPFALSNYQNFYLPGQILIFHVVNISVNRETSIRKRHPNLSPSTFDIYGKLKKLSQRTGTNNRIFRSCDKFYSNNSFFNRSESERNFKVMQNNIFNEIGNSFVVNTVSRSSIIHHTSSSSSSDSISLPIASTSFSLKGAMSYKEKIILNDQALGELQWWIENLKYFNRSYSAQASDGNIDRCLTGRLGIQLQREKWSIVLRKLHLNIRERLAVKHVILAIKKEKTISAIYIQTDNTIALSYLLKMGGGTTEKTLLDLNRDIWKYLILKQITINAEYFPGILNIRADWQSRYSKDFSEWKLSPIVFQHICQKMGIPVIDLFASRLSNETAKYFAWQPDPHSLATDTMQHKWDQEILYAFPPFSLIQRVLCKIAREKVSK